MVERRIAFAAEYWGEGAVVCLAREDEPGPVVEQQFGLFDTWTHANQFANKLNEGLEISPADAREIVISATLAREEMLRMEEAPIWRFRPTVRNVRELRLRSLLLELDTAVSVCRSARMLRRVKPSERAILNAHRMTTHANEVVRTLRIAKPELEEIHSRLDQLTVELEALASATEREAC